MSCPVEQVYTLVNVAVEGMNPDWHETEHDTPDARLLAHADRLTLAPKLDSVQGAGVHVRFADVLIAPSEHDRLLLVALLEGTKPDAQPSIQLEPDDRLLPQLVALTPALNVGTSHDLGTQARFADDVSAPKEHDRMLLPALPEEAV